MSSGLALRSSHIGLTNDDNQKKQSTGNGALCASNSLPIQRTAQNMILTRAHITRQVAAGNITISPFSEARLNPTSYDYHLGDEILELPIEDGAGEKTMIKKTPENGSGILLVPGHLYLSNTLETIGSRKFVVLLSGRPSVGRLGLFVQLSANLGNLGDAHRWTLELSCIQPIIVYPGMLIGQLTFWQPEGEITYYAGAYTKHSRPVGNLRRFT